MVNTYQHTHDFAKHLQEIVDDGEYAQLLDNLRDPENFPLIHEMPHQSRYKLVHDVATAIPRGCEEDYPKAQEAMAFLLMSIPYEPLNSSEKADAVFFADQVKLLDESKVQYSSDQRMRICQAFGQQYAEMNEMESHVSIGRFWLPDNAPDWMVAHYNNVEALYLNGPASEMKHAVGYHMDAHDKSMFNIMIKKEAFENNPIADVVESVLHEIRHHQQLERPGIEIAMQKESGVNAAIRGRPWRLPYLAQMEERQTFGYTGWIMAQASGKRVTSEMEATWGNLSRAGLSLETQQAMLMFNYDYNRKDRGAKPLLGRAASTAQRPQPMIQF